MKTTLIMKTFRLGALAAFVLGSSLAQADNNSCVLGSNSPVNAQAIAPNEAADQALLSALEARMNQQLDRIEQSLRNGEITAMEAGKLMREQWGVMQYQRGILEASRSGKPAGSGEGCGIGQNIDAKQLAAKLAPVVSSMAVEGVQTASMMMRAVAKEAQKMLREQAAQENRP